MSNKIIVNGVDVSELIERDTPKKLIKCNYEWVCPNCKSYKIEFYNYDQSQVKLEFCQDCGQRLDWSESE